MRTLTEIISTKRSGHHAFIEWIGAGSAVVFFNNPAPTSPPRLREAVRWDGLAAPKGDSERVSALLEGPDNAIVNFEGRQSDSITAWNEAYLSPKLSGNLRRIVFLRDPLNLFASLARRTKKQSPHALFQFYQQALAFESIINALETADAFEHCVIFSAWLTNENYRAKLAEALDIPGGPPPEVVTAFGGGSSFEGRTFDPKVDQNRLFERWRNMVDHPLYLSLFADPALYHAMMRYFIRFAADEHVAPEALDVLARNASANERGKELARGPLTALRNCREQIVRLERSRSRVFRTARQAILHGRIFASQIL